MSFEDNNPFAAERRYSNSSSVSGVLQGSHSTVHAGQSKPSLQSPGEEREDPALTPSHREPAHRHYATRIEHYLLEEHSTIHIIDAGKSSEGSGSYIVYTIKTGDLVVKRRYSEFESLRNSLARLFPVLVVPCIPEKHSMSDYAAAPTKAKEDIQIIDHRKRMLGVFLNRCASIEQIRENTVFHRFLDPQASWSEVVSSPPISTIPKNILKTAPLNPSEPTPEHAHLPTPSSSAKLHEEEDPVYEKAEADAKEYESVIVGLEKVDRRVIKRLADIASDHAELGARYNAFSLSESGALAAAIERIGQAMDSSYLATEEMVLNLSSGFAEPVSESSQLAQMLRSVLKYRKQKAIQLEMTVDALGKNRANLEGLERSEQEARRIEAHLRAGGSPSGTATSPSADPEGEERFPPTHEEGAQVQRKRSSGGFKVFGKLNHAIHGIIDVDPETTRRNNIGKTRETIEQLEGALVVARKDVQEANGAVKRDLARFHAERANDLRRIMGSFAQSHVEWAKKNLETWEEAKSEVEKLKV